LKALAEAIIKGDRNNSIEITKAAIDKGIVPKSILDGGRCRNCRRCDREPRRLRAIFEKYP
jgi:hypothetical protein